MTNTLHGFNAKAARLGMTGAVRIAKPGTAIPKLTEDYDDEFRNVGYISPDGVEISFDETTNDFVPWQEFVSIRTEITQAIKKIKFTLWESDLANLAWFLGIPESAITADGDISTFYEGSIPGFEQHMTCLDVVDKKAHIRVTLMAAQITARDSMVFKKEDMFGLGIEMTAYPASADDYGESAPEAVGNTAHWQVNSAWALQRQADSVSTDGVTPLTIKVDGAPAIKENENYSFTPVIAGGEKPYSVAATPKLPTGLSLDKATGAITGKVATVPEEGIETMLEVTDAKGLKASAKLTINK